MRSFAVGLVPDWHDLHTLLSRKQTRRKLGLRLMSEAIANAYRES
ncbi:hypothetical protein RBB78_24700 [Tunturiibacter empetritectus]